MGNSDNKNQDISETVSVNTEAARGVMAGPDKEEPVASTNIMDSKEIPVKASPPRENSPSVSEVKEVEDVMTSSVTPPDGGWGWAVVFASFMIHIIGKNKLISFYFECT